MGEDRCIGVSAGPVEERWRLAGAAQDAECTAHPA
jgi:hypothetical protein